MDTAKNDVGGNGDGIWGEVTFVFSAFLFSCCDHIEESCLGVLAAVYLGGTLHFEHVMSVPT